MAINRLIGILTVLLREEQVTAGALAERFEVSPRTIARDVERLCQAGIPLRTTRGTGGGISIMEGYAMDRTLLTDADRGAILAGLRSLDSVSGTGYYKRLMEKLPQSQEAAEDDNLPLLFRRSRNLAQLDAVLNSPMESKPVSGPSFAIIFELLLRIGP